MSVLNKAYSKKGCWVDVKAGSTLKLYGDDAHGVVQGATFTVILKEDISVQLNKDLTDKDVHIGPPIPFEELVGR